MPFGWTSSEFDDDGTLQDAIDKAYSKKVLMLAAASNSGVRSRHAYPSSSPEVMCIHSANADGWLSGFSPAPASFFGMYLATLGEAVESAGMREDFEARSGTSVATAIAKGICGFLIMYARAHLPEEARRLRRKQAMEKLLTRGAEVEREYTPWNVYDYVQLRLTSHNLFRRDMESVKMEIKKVLRG